MKKIFGSFMVLLLVSCNDSLEPYCGEKIVYKHYIGKHDQYHLGFKVEDYPRVDVVLVKKQTFDYYKIGDTIDCGKIK